MGEAPHGRGLDPPGISGALPLRPFRANGFSLLVPKDWIDLTMYTLVEQAASDAPHWLRIMVDEHPPGSTPTEFGDATVRAVLERAPGGRLLRKVEKLDLALPAAHAELRWSPTDDLHIYQRYLFLLSNTVGFTLSTQMSKRSRITMGPTLDAIMRSFRARDPARGDSPAPPDRTRFRADRFTLDHPPGWVDRTVYTLAEPPERGFRRNVVVRRESLEEEPFSIGHLLEAEAADLAAAIPGLEFLERTEITTRDRRAAARLVCRRPAEGGPVEQAHLLAPRGRDLHVVTMTYEVGAKPEMRASAMAVLGSFALDDAPKDAA